MTKLMKVITTIINIIYGFVSFTMCLFAFSLVSFIEYDPVTKVSNLDRRFYCELAAFPIPGFVVINVILYIIYYLIKRRIPILQFAKYSVLPWVIVNLILLGIVYIIEPIMLF